MTALLEKNDDIDFFWLDGKPEIEKNATLLVGLQGEEGHAGFLTMMGCVGEAEPVAYLCSRLQSVEAFNTIPEPMHPGWILYRVENEMKKVVYVLRITNWFSLVARPDSNPHAWLYSYSMVRDTLQVLVSLGVNDLVLLTTNVIQRFMLDGDESVFLDIDNGEYVVYDFGEDSQLKNDLLLNMPSWIFPYIFNLMTGEQATIVCAGYDKEEPTIDKEARNALSKYCSYYLDMPANLERIDKMQKLLEELHSEIELDSAQREGIGGKLNTKVKHDKIEDEGGMYQ